MVGMPNPQTSTSEQSLQSRLNLTEIVSGAIAVIITLCVCILAVYGLVKTGQVPDLPSWLTAIVGAIIGAYFGARSSAVTGSGNTKT